MQFTDFPHGENCLSPGEQLLAVPGTESAVVPSRCAGQGVMRFPSPQETCKLKMWPPCCIGRSLQREIGLKPS